VRLRWLCGTENAVRTSTKPQENSDKLVTILGERKWQKKCKKEEILGFGWGAEDSEP
jgi:hypothetical protein